MTVARVPCSVLLVLGELLVCHRAVSQVGAESQTWAGITEAACKLWEDPSKPCRFLVSGSEFQLTPSGQLTRLSPSGKAVEVRLPLWKQSRVEHLYYGLFRGDMILVYEVGDGVYGGGIMVRMDKDSLRRKWRLDLPGFNLSEAAIEGARMYQACIGFVSAIDLNRGKFLWKHADLYDEARASFNAFQRPEIVGDEVVFKEEPWPRQPARIIRVAKNTGTMRLE